MEAVGEKKFKLTKVPLLQVCEEQETITGQTHETGMMKAPGDIL